MLASANPFDPRTVLLARHAQHVVLIHFPIALFTMGVAFDLAAEWVRWRESPGTSGRNLSDAAYYNLLVAALFALPVLITGILAWQLALEGQRLKGILLAHLVLGFLSAVFIWISWWLHFRGRRLGRQSDWTRLLVEIAGLLTITLTGHLGGFLSGVSGV
jgi:uncharacterized membrane protein